MKLSFKFVDRLEERKELATYFKGNTSGEQGIWLSGPTNAGKTALICEVKKSVGGQFIHVNMGEYSYNYFEYFLAHISDSKIFENMSLLHIISTDSPEIDSLLTKNYSNYHNLYQEKRLELVHFLYEDVYSSNVNILIEYIQMFTETNNICGVVFDDFENCDSKSLKVLQQFIAYIVDKCISLCFITNSDKKLSNNISQFLFENLDIKDVYIDAFDDVFFYEEFINSCTSIPSNSFSCNQLNRIYSFTHGRPGELKRFLNVLRSKGIFSCSSLGIEQSIDQLISQTEKSNYAIPQNSYAKDILIILYVYFTPIELKLLLNIFTEIYEQNDTIGTLLSTKIIDLVDTMENEGILIINEDQTVNFKTKSIKQHMGELLSNNDKARFFYIVNTLIELNKKGWFIERGCNKVVAARINALGLLIQNSKEAAKCNLKLSQMLFAEGNYGEAIDVLDRIKHLCDQLSPDEIIQSSNQLYTLGEYGLALNYINTIKYNTLDGNRKTRYHIIRGKIRFILIDPECIKDFEAAKKINKDTADLDTKVEISNLLFMAYSENKYTLNKAKQEFQEAIICKCQSIAYAKLCRNALNVLSYTEALPIMLEGLSIAKACRDKFEIAKCQHNIAFLKLMYIQDLAKLEGLKSGFINSSRFFQSHNATHESAYSLNNYAVILMLQQKWEDACNYLRKARVLTNSSYALYAINCNLLLASCFPETVSREEMIEKLEKQYNKMLKNNVVDNRIMRKHLINFAIIALRYNDYETAKLYLNACRPFLCNSPSIARFNCICKLTNETICTNEHNIGTAQQYYRDFSFEPWILSFGHD